MSCMSFIVPHSPMIWFSRSFIQILYIMNFFREASPTCTTTSKTLLTYRPRTCSITHIQFPPVFVPSVKIDISMYLFLDRTVPWLPWPAGSAEIQMCTYVARTFNLVYETLRRTGYYACLLEISGGLSVMNSFKISVLAEIVQIN